MTFRLGIRLVLVACALPCLGTRMALGAIGAKPVPTAIRLAAELDQPSPSNLPLTPTEITDAATPAEPLRLDVLPVPEVNKAAKANKKETKGPAKSLATKAAAAAPRVVRIPAVLPPAPEPVPNPLARSTRPPFIIGFVPAAPGREIAPPGPDVPPPAPEPVPNPLAQNVRPPVMAEVIPAAPRLEFAGPGPDVPPPAIEPVPNTWARGVPPVMTAVVPAAPPFQFAAPLATAPPLAQAPVSNPTAQIVLPPRAYEFAPSTAVPQFEAMRQPVWPENLTAVPSPRMAPLAAAESGKFAVMRNPPPAFSPPPPLLMANIRVAEDVKQVIPAPSPPSTPPAETIPTPPAGADADRDQLIAQERPIGSLVTSIAPASGLLPKNSAATRFTEGADALANRDWESVHYSWDAPALCYGPLRYEQINVERYGYSHCPLLQPALSGAHFFCSTVALPYSIVARPPWECIYPLGHYRPGSPVPYRHHWPVIDVPATAAEVGTIAGLILLIP